MRARAGLGAVLLALGALGAGCYIPTMRPSVQALSELGDSATLVVGQIVMDPPFADGEKDLSAPGAVVVGKSRLEKSVWILVGPGPYQGEDEPAAEAYAGAIETPWRSLFYARFGRKPAVLQLAAVMMTLSQKAYYPLNLKLDIRPDDEAVYIGSLLLKRDDFNNPAGLTVRDDYNAAFRAVQARYGRGVRLRKALARKA